MGITWGVSQYTAFGDPSVFGNLTKTSLNDPPNGLVGFIKTPGITNAVDINPSSTAVATGTAEGWLLISDAKIGEQILKIAAHNGSSVRSVRYGAGLLCRMVHSCA